MDNSNIINCKDKKTLTNYLKDKVGDILAEKPKVMRLKPKTIPEMIVPYSNHGEIIAILIEENGRVKETIREYIRDVRAREFYLMDEFFDYYFAGYEIETQNEKLIISKGEYLVYCDGDLRRLTLANIKRYYKIHEEKSSQTIVDPFPKMYCKNSPSGTQPVIMY